MFMNAIIKMRKTLPFISALQIEWLWLYWDRIKVITQVFTTIELCSGDTTSCCWKATGFGRESSDTSFGRKREAMLVRGITDAHFKTRLGTSGRQGDHRLGVVSMPFQN